MADRHPPGERSIPARRPAALAGVLATGVALGLAELAAGLLAGTGSLVLAIGDVVIAAVPGWLERAAIATLGTADKPTLVGGILVLSAVFGAGLGLLGRRRELLADAGLVGFAALGVAAALVDERTTAAAAVTAGVAGAVGGVLTLRWLLRAAPRDAGPPLGDDAEAVPDATTGMGRRPFLVLAAVAAGVAAVGAGAGRWLASSEAVERVRAAVRIPRPQRSAPPVAAGAELDVPGLSPLFTPNADFYRIDTALSVPRVDPARWSLEVRGMVDEPFTLSYDELLALPHVEADVTLSCVSNMVGGDLVGNARWQGVPLHVLLERAGVRPGATQLLGRSVDGFSAGFPTELAVAIPEAMVAVAMNGEPLPADHGFPARIVVPGLYGYVSATKWLQAIELTTFEAVEGYWIPRGWAREGPVKTQSRIDVPRPSSTVPAGRTAVAGVAWAPTRGIERVEVQVDDGAWVEARLADALHVDTWRQWVHEWEATPGRHTLAVRATDGTGETQTAERTPVAPDGATGRHTIEVVVEG
jgi:DMSO/TMAO reductase YedYZ molybdopterin-dependent catalytic subunit